MMGLGYLGNGGSTSSSSNLSALAPPFTVDRSSPKPMSNPLGNFNEPPYAMSFNSLSPEYWNAYCEGSRPDFFSNVNPVANSNRTTCVPSVNNFGYSGSQTINTPSAKDAIDVSYLRYLGNLPTSLIESKAFYSPYVAPVVDDDSPLVALNESSFDLLPMSHVVPSDVPSQVDYTRSLSGLEYAPKWGGIWNGLANEEHGKRVELEENFGSEEMNIAGTYVSSNYIEQGARLAETLRKCEEDSAVLHSKYVDILEREKGSVTLDTEQLDDKSLFAQNPIFKVNAVGSSRTSTLGATTVFPESHVHVPSLKLATDSWNPQKSHIPPHEKCFQLLDSCISGTKSSPALVIRPPATGTISAPSKVPSENRNFIGDIDAVNSDEFDDRNTSKRKEAHLLPSSEGKERCFDTSRLGFYLGGNDSFFASSSTQKEELPNRLVTKDGLDHTFKARSDFQVPDMNAPDGFALMGDSAKNVGSIAYSSESLDHHNPAEDSPCWKGAPSFHFSPFEESKAAIPQHLMKTLETSNSLNLGGTQILSPYADDSMKVSSHKLCEVNAYNENGCKKDDYSFLANRSFNCYSAAKEHRSDDAVKVRLDCPKRNSSSGVQFSNYIDKLRKGDDLQNYSTCESDFKSSQAKQQEREERLKVWAGVVDMEMNSNDALEYGSVPLHTTMENVPFLPSGEDAMMLAELQEGESAPRMNVQMLVKAMHNLSELLLCHCSNDVSALREQDHEALKHAINNLDACVSKKSSRMFPQQGISREHGELPDLNKGASASKPKVTGEKAANSHGQVIHKEKKNHNDSGKNLDTFPDFLSLRDGTDIARDDSMVQAIKKVLDENFEGEDEMQTQTLLYKNLWLEAEAALCSINYRARFDRMKIEMKKCNSLKAKGVLGDTGPVEKLPNWVFTRPNIKDKLIPDAIYGQIPDVHSQESPISSTNNQVDDVDASVLSRFQILKCHGVLEDTGAGEKLPSSGVSSHSNVSDKLILGAKDRQFPDISSQESPISSTTSHVDDVEASVRARFEILKCRGESSSSAIMEGEQLLKDVDAESTVNRLLWPFSLDQLEGGHSNMGSEPHLKHVGEKFGPYIGSNDHETVKDVTDEPVIQSCGNSRLWSQLPSVCSDSTSSDWEHVLKDDFAWKN